MLTEGQNKEETFTQDLDIWNSHPQLMALESSKVAFAPSVHHVDNHIIFIVSQDSHNSESSIQLVTLIFHKDVAPFEETHRFQVQ